MKNKTEIWQIGLNYNVIMISICIDNLQTFASKLLIAVNPFRDLPNLYGSTEMKVYQGKSIHAKPPHIYAMGEWNRIDSFFIFKVNNIIIMFFSQQTKPS